MIQIPASLLIWIKRAIFIPIAIVAGVFVFGSAVMLLWNSLFPAIFGVTTITFWQAIGLFVLSKILFGGFGGRHGHHRFHHRGHAWDGRWIDHLTPEQKEMMKSEWRGRCCEPAEKQE